MNKSSKIYVAGHRGLVGSALIHELKKDKYENIVVRTHVELDLTDRKRTMQFFNEEKPEYVFLAAAKVGGINANTTFPADFIYTNITIQTNVIHSAWANGVKRLMFLGSSCIYPRDCLQPIKEEYLLSGYLEPTNRAYAVAKISGIEMCRSYNYQYGTEYLSVMPTNLYGPNDNYDLENSHVIPALIRKIYEAKSGANGFVKVWGSGKPRREFLYSRDMAKACIYLMNLSDIRFDGFIGQESRTPIINIGFGKDIAIYELAALIKETLAYEGELIFDSSKPDGMPLKLLDNTRLTQLGWQPEVGLKEGLAMTYDAFISETYN